MREEDQHSKEIMKVIKKKEKSLLKKEEPEKPKDIPSITAFFKK